METDLNSLTILAAGIAARLHIDRKRVSVRSFPHYGRTDDGEVVVQLEGKDWRLHISPGFIREHAILEIADSVLNEWLKFTKASQ